MVGLDSEIRAPHFEKPPAVRSLRVVFALRLFVVGWPAVFCTNASRPSQDILTSSSNAYRDNSPSRYPQDQKPCSGLRCIRQAYPYERSLVASGFWVLGLRPHCLGKVWGLVFRSFEPFWCSSEISHLHLGMIWVEGLEFRLLL